MEPLQQETLDGQARARNWFRLLTGSDDAEAFQAAYLGHYPSRSAFGEQLLEETYAASERLRALPSTLLAYVRLDAEQVASDWERAGHFRLYDADPEQPDAGIYVFDAHGIGALDRAGP